MISRVKALLRGRRSSFEVARGHGMKVGQNVSVDASALFDENHAWLIEIGDDVTVAPEAYFLAHDASTKRTLGYTRIGRTRIERGVFIGARAMILPGITVGSNAIVAAGSVVARNVPPGTIVAGNPAREIGDAAAYLDREAEEVSRLPCFPADGYTVGRGITQATKQEMVNALADRRGFVE